ncbi:hypothetical protein [Paraburkholderia elongata]|uniref:hypothetical protein n=1 Tax=Paraburkholderia elongata TaxID=2675747 RepID=UPI0038B23C47
MHVMVQPEHAATGDAPGTCIAVRGDQSSKPRFIDEKAVWRAANDPSCPVRIAAGVDAVALAEDQLNRGCRFDLAKINNVADLNLSAGWSDVALYRTVACGRATLIDTTSSHTYRISDENTVSFHGSGGRIARCNC